LEYLAKQNLHRSISSGGTAGPSDFSLECVCLKSWAVHGLTWRLEWFAPVYPR